MMQLIDKKFTIRQLFNLPQKQKPLSIKVQEKTKQLRINTLQIARIKLEQLGL